ncbi:hypothetical protein CSUI_008934, partial [Cystoisospora suis]
KQRETEVLGLLSRCITGAPPGVFERDTRSEDKAEEQEERENVVVLVMTKEKEEEKGGF